MTRIRSSHASVVVALLLGLAGTSLAEPAAPSKIRRVDLVHMTHTDIGYTDHPVVTRELQKRYLDIAIDAVLASSQKPAGARFCWTAETTLAVDDWWRTAGPTRRGELLRAVDTGRLEIAALAMNQTPLMNAAQWQTMLHWLPEDLWKRVHPQVGIQNDVNGCPRAGAMAMLDRGVSFLWMGVNTVNGGSPFRQPSAFWWKMPDGRRLFVWQGDAYSAGYYYFHPESWRVGPVPEASDTRYRPARPGDFFRADEASVRAAHAFLLTKLASLERQGYDYPTLLLSTTNEWRMDNDPPFPAMADFVETWQRLKLAPELRLTTAGEAIRGLQKEIGDRVPEHQGEWTDWWANGSASGPREIAASRIAKRATAAALSPVWGPVDDRTRLAADDIFRSLCLFDEHTWGASDSVGQPHSPETWGQYNEKSRHAYRAMALSKWLLAQRARSVVYQREPGFYVVNTAADPWSGWLTMPSTCLRGRFLSLADAASGESAAIEYRPGYTPWSRPAGPETMTYENTSDTFADNTPDRMARVWVSNLKPHEVRRCALSMNKVEATTPKATPPEVALDAHGWPLRATWPGMKRPLFDGQVGEIVNVALLGSAARWDLDRLRAADRSKREAAMKISTAQPAAKTQVERGAHTTLFTQQLSHPRLLWATRCLELFHDEPRARVTVRFHRTSSERPEWFFLGFALPTEGVAPMASCGGVPFRPFLDQLPRTCRDYFGIDGWLSYSTPAGRYLWASRDVPLVRFGDSRPLETADKTPDAPGRIYATAFDNTWFTNFVADSHGALEFQFDLAWSPEAGDPADDARWAETLQSDPQVVIQPDLKPDARFLERGL